MTLHREKSAFDRKEAALGFIIRSLYSVLALLLPTPAWCGADPGGASAGAEWLPSLYLISPFLLCLASNLPPDCPAVCAI